MYYITSMYGVMRNTASAYSVIENNCFANKIKIRGGINVLTL